MRSVGFHTHPPGARIVFLIRAYFLPGLRCRTNPIPAASYSYRSTGIKAAPLASAAASTIPQDEVTMLRVFTLTAVLAFASAIAFAETWTGTLVDAACAAQQKTA